MQSRSSRTLKVVVFGAQLALAGCHKSGGSSGDVQATAPAGSAEQGPRVVRVAPAGGIGFDDLIFAPALKQIVAPAGATGCVDLFDAASLAKHPLCGLSTSGGYSGGHGEGVTSADVGAGWLFAVDRTSQSMKVASLDRAHAGQAAKGYPLSGQPDYVRWVESQREVWVTEPDQEQIEVFALAVTGSLMRTKTIAVKGGPESLVVDAARGRAYSHLWAGGTVAIDLSKHALVEQFPNGCKGSRGIALSSRQGLLFVGCSEGKAVVLDIDHGGKVLSTAATASGVDIIAVNLELKHLYVPAASDGSVTVFAIHDNGTLSKLGALAAAKGAHCVASDDHARVWVCAPDAGALLVFDDTFPRTPE